MVHWFDRLSKAVARASHVQAGQPSTSSEPFGYVQTETETILQAGPCQTTLRGNELVRRYATQASRSTGGLLTLESAATRDLETHRSSYHLAIRTEREAVVDLRIDAGLETPASMTLIGVSESGRVVTLTGEIEDERWRWWVDGEEAPDPGELLQSDPATASEDDLFSSIPMGELGLHRQLLDDVRDIAYRAVRDAPTCAVAPPVMSTMSGEHFPGCIDCVDKCDDHWPTCAAEASAKAAACWVGYFACLAYHMSQCMGKEADCYNACHAGGGACCPQKCERIGYAECCASGGICCGAQCCDDGSLCADPSNDLCCAPNHGDACGSHCCDQGFKCADESRGFCCPRDAGEYCTIVWDEEHWAPRCCPPGQVCADGSIGLCCDEGHGPICGDFCCKRNEVCQNGQCCDPRMLCGYGEHAVCCDGECRDGFCCGKPSHMCGDTCCPPFNPCCVVDGRRVCCGAYDECTPGGCCPRELVCGRACCERGYMCADPSREKCVPCEGDTVACLTMDYESKDLFSICCHPSVDCCNGKCCEPGTMCCAPGGDEPGCYPSHHCVH
jgi:hypothetical protein